MRQHVYRLRSAIRSRVLRLRSRSVLDEYVTAAPSGQTALDIFAGEWISKLPAQYALRAGTIPLFEDDRISSALQTLGGIEGKTVLELGPLEGAHTFMLHERGAARITAVEANTRAYLKCLVVKEVLELTRATFLCGDFVQYLRTVPEPVDFCLASGVLYHMRNPVELLALICGSAEQLFLWTHYYDHEIISRQPHIAANFSARTTVEHEGFSHTLYRQEYAATLFSRAFIGGTGAYSQWMSKDDLIAALQHFGMRVTSLELQLAHPHGPSLSLTAERSR